MKGPPAATAARFGLRTRVSAPVIVGICPRDRVVGAEAAGAIGVGITAEDRPAINRAFVVVTRTVVVDRRIGGKRAAKEGAGDEAETEPGPKASVVMVNAVMVVIIMLALGRCRQCQQRGQGRHGDHSRTHGTPLPVLAYSLFALPTPIALATFRVECPGTCG